MTAIAPTVSGVVSNYSISPALPSGLTLNPIDGQISGTPTATSNGAFTITAANSSASTTFSLTINVSNPPPPVAAPQPSLIVAIKELRFGWTDVSDASSYRLERSTDGLTFSTVGAEIAHGKQATSVGVAVHDLDWRNTVFRLAACNLGGCTSSQPLSIAGLSAQAVGFIKASNADPNDHFGHAVAVSADGLTAVVGAPDEDSSSTTINGDQNNNDYPAPGAGYGAAYVFVKTAAGWMQQQAYVKASSNMYLANFANAVSLSADGNLLAIGFGADSVYVFKRVGTQWSEQDRIMGHGANFGKSVALSGDGSTLAIGSSDMNDGTVYVATRSGDDWTEQQALTAAIPHPSAEFGYCVDISDDGRTIAVGSRTEGSYATGINGSPTYATSSAGAAYVFQRDTTQWIQQAYVKASNTDSGDWFGHSITLSGDGNTLAVGAVGEDGISAGVNGSQANGNGIWSTGAVYVYSRTGATWQQDAYVKAINPGGDDVFGSAVALSPEGDMLAVGAPAQDGGGSAIGSDPNDFTMPFSGAVYIYKRVAGAWTPATYVKAPTVGDGDLFGSSVALSAQGTTLVVGAIREASDGRTIGANQVNNSSSQSGAAYLY